MSFYKVSTATWPAPEPGNEHPRLTAVVQYFCGVLGRAGEAVLSTRACTGFGQASACPPPGAPLHACVGVPEMERVLW